MKQKHIRAYMECAEAFARCSASRRLKVGSVIVKNNNIISTGYNALPEHLHGPLEDADGNTLSEVIHSEQNALQRLIRSTESSVGAALFCTHACCKKCAILIVDSGIEKFYYKRVYRCDSGIKYLQANGVVAIKL